MKQEYFRIFFTSKAPITQEGKNNLSVWKNADSFYDFFSLRNVEKSSVKIKFYMLYDKTNLYIHTTASTPDTLRITKDSVVSERPCFHFLFSLGKSQEERTLKIVAREEGSCEIAVKHFVTFSHLNISLIPKLLYIVFNKFSFMNFFF